ncbi:MAG: TusE/DsrC/DsvC family sulfur relay protein [Patescibacteria group bacterium]
MTVFRKILSGKEFIINEDNCLTKSSHWSQEWTDHILANNDAIDELTQLHWDLINFVRKFHEKYDIAPMLRQMCNNTKINSEQIYTLFPPKGPVTLLQFAGIPYKGFSHCTGY